MARMSGDHPKVGRRGAHVVHDLEHITLIADEPLPFQVDGDALDSREKVTFRSVANAISVVQPAAGAPVE
jgi:diacylglycerol kinase family enzyme